MGAGKKIDSLQALRAIAFLGIFFRHALFLVSWPCLSVSVFFVISGFLMIYKYGEADFNISVKNNLKFSLSKIKKIYPLHIITMLCAVIVIIRNGLNIDLIKKIFLNVTLLQTWVPNSSINVSLNGVAWYLSVTMFLYFIFPFFHKIVKRKNMRELCIICVLILIVEVLLCIPFISILGNNSPVYIWFMYCFPVFRAGDFFVGCVMYKVYAESKIIKMGKIKASIYEVFATIITVIISLWLGKGQTNIILQALHNWTTLYIPLAAIWVLLFSVNKGFITKILTNRLFIFIGNISSYAFLIHYVVTQYTLELLRLLKIEVYGWEKFTIVFAELVLSILFSVVYKSIHKKCFDSQNIYGKGERTS